MSSYLGSNGIGKLYLGGTEIAKAYLGSTLIYESGGGPTPPIEPVFYTNLIFDGTAIVQTDYVLPSGCSLRATIGGETLKAAQGVFITEGGGGKIQIQYGGATSSTRRQFLPFYDSSSYLSSNRYLNFSYSSYALWMTQKRFGWGNDNYTYTKGALHPTGGICFGGGGATPFTGFIRTFQIFGSDTQNATSYNAFNNYTPVATFRPCTYNGEAGMWYVEGNKFFGNTAGSGQLTASN